MSPRETQQDTPDPIVFRYDVTREDRAVVRTIVASTGFFNPAEVEVAVELVDERLAKGPASGYHFIFAEQGGRTSGYVCYGPIAGTAASYDLFWIAVDISVQRQGLGKVLLAESERLIRLGGGGRIYIETSNRGHYVSTRAFYERNGYTLEAVLKDFYAPGDDKAIYVKAVE
jgi:ribosomal protein S18 acetylase RimI-like enzyme